MRADHVFVTGGSGYIGARLVEHALAQGRSVTGLGRKLGPPGTSHAAWTLSDPLPAGIAVPEGARALIHRAHDWRAGPRGNIEGTERLFASARD